MKIQSLAIIFVIIILPISIVLSEYINVQIDTIKLQTNYDSKLIDATYDAVVAYQKNTVNSNFSDIKYSKMRDIEASANVFLNSVANNFTMAGNSVDAIKEYVPAIVYTLYDGYYIYTPFYNELGGDIVLEDNTYANGKRIFGLKPYIYYSKRYTETNYDIVITYSLDNHIAIQGIIDGKAVNENGYVIDISDMNPDGTKYKGFDIRSKADDTVWEYADETDTLYECAKVNGTKYYKDNEEKIFYYIQNNPNYLSTAETENFDNYFGENNTMAQDYYREAYEFTNKILNTYDLTRLEDSNGEKIFKNNAEDVEYYSSNFNQERRAVIKEAIEKNLSVSIANFNQISETSNVNFQMPKLQEDEWDKIINNISVISFVQGVTMGTRTYNGYAIVTNNKNNEMVGEESIYIVTDDGWYHRVNDKDLIDGSIGADQILQGALNTNFERKVIDRLNDEGSVIKKDVYFPRIQKACYDSIILQSGINTMQKKLQNGALVPETVYEYLEEIKSKATGMKLGSIYYTALGRERQGQNRMINYD